VSEAAAGTLAVHDDISMMKGIKFGEFGFFNYSPISSTLSATFNPNPQQLDSH